MTTTVVMHPPHAALSIGQRMTTYKHYSREDVERWTGLVGDSNPLHRNTPEARASRFGAPILPGCMLTDLWSTLLGCWLPGPGTIYLSQSAKFRDAVFVGQAVTASVEIVKVREDKPIVTLRCEIRNGAGVLCVEGEAVVLWEPVEEVAA